MNNTLHNLVTPIGLENPRLNLKLLADGISAELIFAFCVRREQKVMALLVDGNHIENPDLHSFIFGHIQDHADLIVEYTSATYTGHIWSSSHLTLAYTMAYSDRIGAELASLRDQLSKWSRP